MLAHPALECFAWSVLPGEVQGAGSQLGDVGPVDGLDEHLTGGKVPVERRVAAALLGPRTIEQLNDLLAGAEVTLSDDVLDQIDAIIPPGTGVGQLQMGYVPSALTVPHLRRRPPGERTAA